MATISATWGQFMKSPAAPHILATSAGMRISELIAAVKKESPSIKIPIHQRVVFAEKLLEHAYPGQFEIVEDRLGKSVVRLSSSTNASTSGYDTDDSNVSSECDGGESTDEGAMTCDEGKMILSNEKKKIVVHALMRKEARATQVIQNRLAMVMQNLQGSVSNTAEEPEFFLEARKRPYLSMDYPESTSESKRRRLIQQEASLNEQGATMRCMFQEAVGMIQERPSAAVELLLKQAASIDAQEELIQKVVKENEEGKERLQRAINEKVEALMVLATK
jgi:hypothetical protein